MIYSMVMSWPRLACASSDDYFLRSGFSRQALSIIFFSSFAFFFSLFSIVPPPLGEHF
ncbi:hypothetical protein BDV24DRAFT_137464 [Aspergillus arachidicola]|uniref:Uncharacterized protein n=1 Tax=Aspergillus arachidicola TaxID=656916 RepID=A0A5N6XZR1_9EURO|nr:hypothetical protein BDV24DRAFT_137464 [Aspergillus arachidicola]